MASFPEVVSIVRFGRQQFNKNLVCTVPIELSKTIETVYQIILVDRGTCVWKTCPESLPISTMVVNRAHSILTASLTT